MFSSTITLNVPDIGYIIGHHWQGVALIGAVFVIALAASIILEVYRRHYKKKEQIQLAKHYTALLLGGLTTLFTTLGYLLVFAGSNPSLLKGVPFIAEHSTEAIGIAVTLYNIRLNKWYQKAADFLNKWSKDTDDKKPAAVTPSGPANTEPAAHHDLLS